MTVARELQLSKNNDTYRLISAPVGELESFKKMLVDTSHVQFKGEYGIYEGAEGILSNSVIEIKLKNLSVEKYNFRLSNETGDSLDFGVDNIDSNYYLDRRNSGLTNFSEKFSNTVSKASFVYPLEEVTLQILLDKTSIEIFINNGETVMTEIFFPNTPFQSLKLNTTNNSDVSIDNLIISQLEFNK